MIEDSIVRSLGVPSHVIGDLGDATNYASSRAADALMFADAARRDAVDALMFALTLPVFGALETRHLRMPHPHNRRWRRRLAYLSRKGL